jgi:hypothetical protein
MWTKEQQDARFDEVVCNYYDAAVNAMDDELREHIHFEMAPCTEEEFLAAYAVAHEAQFGEAFAPLSWEAF